MKIEIITDIIDGVAFYKVVANGVTLSSSRDRELILERALHIKIGANAMLKQLNQMSVTLIGE